MEGNKKTKYVLLIYQFSTMSRAVIYCQHILINVKKNISIVEQQQKPACVYVQKIWYGRFQLDFILLASLWHFSLHSEHWFQKSSWFHALPNSNCPQMIVVKLGLCSDWSYWQYGVWTEICEWPQLLFFQIDPDLHSACRLWMLILLRIHWNF